MMKWAFLDASTHLYKRVCPSVGPSVGWFIRWSIRNAFVKVAKPIAKSLFFACLCMAIACPSIYWSVHTLFCPSVHYFVCLSVYPSFLSVLISVSLRVSSGLCNVHTFCTKHVIFCSFTCAWRHSYCTLEGLLRTGKRAHK